MRRQLVMEHGNHSQGNETGPERCPKPLNYRALLRTTVAATAATAIGAVFAMLCWNVNARPVAMQSVYRAPGGYSAGRYPVDKNALRAYLRHQSHRRLEQLSRTHRSRVSVTPDSLLVRPMQGQAEKRMEHAFSNYLRHQPISVVKRELRGESLNEKEHQESAMRGELHHHAMPPHHQSPSEIEKVAMRILRGNIDWRQRQDQVKHAKVKQHKAASNQDKLRSEGWGRVGSVGSGGNRGRRGLRSGALHESRQPITITRQTIRPDARGGERGERKPGEREPSNAAHVQEDGRKDVGAQGGSVKDEGKEGVGQAAGKEGVGQAAGKEGVGQAAGPPSSPPSVASSSPPSPPTRTHLLVCLSVCCCMQMQCVIEILHEIARKTGGEMGWLESMREAWRAERPGVLPCVREAWCPVLCHES